MLYMNIEHQKIAQLLSSEEITIAEVYQKYPDYAQAIIDSSGRFNTPAATIEKTEVAELPKGRGQKFRTSEGQGENRTTWRAGPSD
jgi:hypothetical protein